MAKRNMIFRVKAMTKVESECDARILAEYIKAFTGDWLTVNVGNDVVFKDNTIVDVDIVAPNRLVAWWRCYKVKRIVKRSRYGEQTELSIEV